MERLKHMKETLVGCIEGQMGHLDTVDTKELGEVIDMVKDLEEAIYYCTITKAMEEKEHKSDYRDMDRSSGKMYYGEPAGKNMGAFAGSSPRTYMDWDYPIMRDKREGRSYMSRKTYMESKEMHQPKTTQMKELEKYLHELGSDITEMLEDATPEEKTLLEKKMAALVEKIGQL